MTWDSDPAGPRATTAAPPGAPTGEVFTRPRAETSRRGWLTAAAVIFLTVGSVTGLLTLLTIAVGLAAGSALREGVVVQSEFEAMLGAESGDAPGRMVGAVVLAIGVIGGLWTVSHVVAGIGILRRREWARLLGTVLAVLGAALALLTLVTALVAVRQDTAVAGLVTTMLLIVPFVLGYALALTVLVRSGGSFAAASAAARPTPSVTGDDPVTN